MTPTEALLFDAFVEMGFADEPDPGPQKCERALYHHGWMLDLWAQLRLDRYRLDFAIGSRVPNEDGTDPFRYVIEVDGPEHDSRLYRRADRERDRLIGLWGATVIRFTNEEVQDDAFACAHDVISSIHPIQMKHLDASFMRFLHERAATGLLRVDAE